MTETTPRIEPWLREILRCPQCKGELTDVRPGAGAGDAAAPVASVEPADAVAADQSTDVTELQCPVCALGYPIESGVPVLLVDLARRLG
jgi:uncharacterized protein YbaR (Trm112 family)